MEHLTEALKRAYKKTKNINILCSAGGFLGCTRMNLAAVSVVVRMWLLSAAGAWWHSPTPPFPSSGEGHLSAMVLRFLFMASGISGAHWGFWKGCPVSSAPAP